MPFHQLMASFWDDHSFWDDQVFVANPNKSKPIVEILTGNQEKLLKYLTNFHTDKGGSASSASVPLQRACMSQIGKICMRHHLTQAMSCWNLKLDLSIRVFFCPVRLMPNRAKSSSCSFSGRFSGTLIIPAASSTQLILQKASASQAGHISSEYFVSLGCHISRFHCLHHLQEGTSAHMAFDDTHSIVVAVSSAVAELWGTLP